MLRKMISLLICMILIISLPVTAKADIGPKPSVRITFTGIEGETYYGTLLSERRSTGPATAWDGYEEYQDIEGATRRRPYVGTLRAVSQ